MKQRVALARALVNRPRMLLMDEPFGALDALTRKNMQMLVRKIWLKMRNTILLITHDVDEALLLATRIVIMSKRPGKILKEFCTEFTYRISEREQEKVIYQREYIDKREKILKLLDLE